MEMRPLDTVFEVGLVGYLLYNWWPLSSLFFLCSFIWWGSLCCLGCDTTPVLPLLTSVVLNHKHWLEQVIWQPVLLSLLEPPWSAVIPLQVAPCSLKSLVFAPSGLRSRCTGYSGDQSVSWRETILKNILSSTLSFQGPVLSLLLRLWPLIGFPSNWVLWYWIPRLVPLGYNNNRLIKYLSI